MPKIFPSRGEARRRNGALGVLIAPARHPRPRTTRRPAWAVTIVEVRPRRNGAIFTTGDGDVWVQTDARRFRKPDTPVAARIRPGALGSHFLVPDEGGRAIRVRRAD